MSPAHLPETSGLTPQQALRDLHWAVTSPLLATGSTDKSRTSLPDDPALLTETQQWLSQLSQNPAPLLDHLAQRERRFLGSYFESLWEFYLRHRRDVGQLWHHQQIYRQGATAGEFDFIWQKQASDQFIHQEVAVKFYLGVPDPKPTLLNGQSPGSLTPSRDDQWLGPNTFDRLDLKLNKLNQQQLRLSELPEAQQWLHRQGIHRLDTQMLVKGYLFYPWAAQGQTILTPPPAASTNHLRGYWLPISQLREIAPLASVWSLVEKPCWLSPRIAPSTSVLNFDQVESLLIQRISEDRRPRMLASMIESQDTDQEIAPVWTETERYFIVPENWPSPP